LAASVASGMDHHGTGAQQPQSGPYCGNVFSLADIVTFSHVRVCPVRGAGVRRHRCRRSKTLEPPKLLISGGSHSAPPRNTFTTTRALTRRAAEAG
jgi:hypothetical protein